IAENFQFSHRVYLLLVSWRSKKMYTLLFCFQAKSTHKNLRYLHNLFCAKLVEISEAVDFVLGTPIS
ncbi:MAG: hypothetical protein WCA15_15915, partial [Candidatus Acidiferrales bacterium]